MSASSANDGRVLVRCVEKQTGARRAEPREVRRSARRKALLQPEARTRGKEAGGGLSPAGQPLLDQVQSRTPHTPLKPSSRRKRGQEAPNLPVPVQDPLPAKRPRKPARGAADGHPARAKRKLATGATDPLSSWVQNKQWPHEYFEPDEQARDALLERDSWLDDIMAQAPIPVVQYVERNGFRYPIPIKKAPTSLRRKQSDSSLGGSSDQKKRESKSTPYRDARYTTMLEIKGSFLRDFDHRIPQAITNVCQQLLAGNPTTPQHSLFRDDLFGRLCWKIQDRNEAMIIQDVTRLVVPSAMNLAIYGDTHLDVLIESANEAWTSSIPVEGPRPQPDYAVGFDRSAFTEEQQQKLGALVGSIFDTSFFVATYRMYFPFLTCEVKCGAAALDIADRQNAHSMTIAVRAVIELYKAVKREHELNREMLAFSISHDHSAVRIHGHYAITDRGQTTFYRHPIKKFDFTSEEGADKWAAYKFTRSVYDAWMPVHLQRICSAIDQLPSSLDFKVSDETGGLQYEEATGLSQGVGSLLSAPSDNGISPQLDEEYDDLALITPQTVTPDASVSKGGKQGAKRAKKNPPKKNSG